MDRWRYSGSGGQLHIEFDRRPSSNAFLTLGWLTTELPAPVVGLGSPSGFGQDPKKWPARAGTSSATTDRDGTFGTKGSGQPRTHWLHHEEQVVKVKKTCGLRDAMSLCPPALAVGNRTFPRKGGETQIPSDQFAVQNWCPSPSVGLGGRNKNCSMRQRPCKNRQFSMEIPICLHIARYLPTPPPSPA